MQNMTTNTGIDEPMKVHVYTSYNMTVIIGGNELATIYTTSHNMVLNTNELYY